MKHILIITAMTMAGFTANAQLIVDSLGRVGIGTPSQYGYTMSAYSDHQGIKSVSNTNTSDTESVGFCSGPQRT